MRRYVRKYKEQNRIRRDYEFMPATLEVLERPPAPFSRVAGLLIILLTVILLAWSSVAKMDIVVSGAGVVVPKGKVKVIQSLEPGIVTAISVADGQVVRRGDVLMKMDSTESVADLSTLEKELLLAELTTSRLSAQLQGEEKAFVPPGKAPAEDVRLQRNLLGQSVQAHRERMAALDLEVSRCRAEMETVSVNVERLANALPLANKLYEKKRTLAEQDMLPDGKYLQAQMEINDVRKNGEGESKRLQEIKARLAKIKEERQLAETEYQREILQELTESRSKQENLILQLAKAQKRQNDRELKSPVDGIVQQLAINTIGGVVTAAQPLMVIVPMEGGLEIEAKIRNKDVGLVSKNQSASVKVAAYPFTRYGDLQGTIEWVAGDAVVDQEMGPIYPVRLSLAGYSLPNAINGRRGNITPGMTVTTDIKVGKRRVIHYFLEPLLRYKDQSLKEW